MSNTKEKIDEVEDTTTTQTEAEGAVSFQITSAHQMFHLVNEWHNHKKAVLSYMLTIPEGTEVQDSEGVTHKVEGDYLTGFRAGLEIALMELNELPFTVSLPPESTPGAGD